MFHIFPLKMPINDLFGRNNLGIFLYESLKGSQFENE